MVEMIMCIGRICPENYFFYMSYWCMFIWMFCWQRCIGNSCTFSRTLCKYNPSTFCVCRLQWCTMKSNILHELYFLEKFTPLWFEQSPIFASEVPGLQKLLGMFFFWKRFIGNSCRMQWCTMKSHTFSWTIFLREIHIALVLISLLYLKQKCQLYKNCFAGFILAKMYGAQWQFIYTPLASNTQAHFVSSDCSDALWNPTFFMNFISSRNSHRFGLNSLLCNEGLARDRLLYSATCNCNLQLATYNLRL